MMVKLKNITMKSRIFDYLNIKNLKCKVYKIFFLLLNKSFFDN